MRKRANLFLGLMAVVLIGYGLATMAGLIAWPEQHARGAASAADVTLSVPCSSVAAATTSATTATGTARVEVSARALGCSNALYQFWMLPPGHGGYQVVQKYSSRSIFTWSPVDVPPGTYQFAVWARDAGGDGVSVNSAGRLDASSVAGTFTVNACSMLGVTVGSSSSRSGRASLGVTAAASGCSHPLYRFWLLAPGAAAYQIVQDYSARPTLSLKISGMHAGTYRIAVWVRDQASSGAQGNGLGRWDTATTTTYRVA